MTNDKWKVLRIVICQWSFVIQGGAGGRREKLWRMQRLGACLSVARIVRSERRAALELSVSSVAAAVSV
jgi:hypothetical protein